MKKWLYIAFLIVLNPGNLPAQQLIFKTYAVNEGLVANPVRRIMQDSKGFLWICTWEGLSKYDGHRFKNFTSSNGLSHYLINDVIEAPNGDIWVAMNNGNTAIIKDDVVQSNEFITGKTINRFFKTSHNKIFAVTDQYGIFEVVNGKLLTRNPDPIQLTFTEIIQVNDSVLAVASLENSIRLFDMNFKPLFEWKSKMIATQMLYAAGNNDFLVGTNTGLKAFKLKEDGLHPQQLPAELSLITVLNNRVIQAFHKDKSGNIWIGTNQGIIHVKSNGAWIEYTEKDGLPSNRIACVMEDNENNIWVGTWQGVVKFNTKNKIEMYGTNHGLGAIPVLNLYQANDKSLVVFCPPYVQYLNREENKFETSFLIQNATFHFINDNKSFVIENQVDLKYFDIDNKQLGTRIFSSKNKILFNVLRQDNTILVGSVNGMYILQGNNVLLDTSLQTRVTALLLDKKKNLWIGTWNEGVFKIPFDKIHQHTKKDFEHYLPGYYIRTLFEDSNGCIWAGTRLTGLIKITETRNGKYETTHIDQKKGLMSTWVMSIEEDKIGNIWVGSLLGLDKLVKTDTGYRIYNFSRINNFHGQVYAIKITDDNHIWCGTSEGLLHIVDEFGEKTMPYPVYITQALLNGKKYHYSGSDEKIELKHNENAVHFEFTAPSYLNEKQVMYSYKLSGGNEEDWSEPANVYNVSYASLQPGVYKFEVRTIGWNGIPGKPVSFEFTINPPYWKTWWFITLMAVAVLIILYFFYRYRINEIMKLSRVRNRLATDLHDDIGSTLTNISILSELSKKNLKEPNQANIFLERITEEVNASGQALDDIIWSVNSRNDTLEETIARMRRYAAELFDASNISYQLDLDEAVSARKLLMEQRRDVYLVFKESLNNIYKHANATTVLVKAGMEQDIFALLITDNGKGFDTKVPTHRNGMKNLKWRVEKWKGDIKIDSATGKGTSISIRIPLQT